MEQTPIRILVVSDTHGKSAELDQVLEQTGPYDYLIHCGDTEGKEDEIEFTAGCPCTIVRGNNDFYAMLPDEDVVELGGYRIYVTHGHWLGVSSGTNALRAQAKEKGCNIACYGHTHKPYLDQSDPELTVLNPGSLAYPRQEGREPSYMIMEIDQKGQVHFMQNYLAQSRHAKKRWF